ncbi:MAG: hypothetical protein ACYDCQ_09490 [Dehalococcoidia bacterium]
MVEFGVEERRLLATLVCEWLEERTGRPAALSDRLESGVWPIDLRGLSVSCVIESASTVLAPAEWQSRLAAYNTRLANPAEAGVLVWLPSGAELPRGEPAQTEIVDALNRAIAGLAPGEAADAALPIALHIRKRDETGAYVSAYGALSAHWARFTDRVQGYFQIDSTALHRLPADETTTLELVDRLIEASRGLELDGAATIDAADYWRIQRLRGGTGIAVVATPPDDESETGAPLRKRLRGALRQAGDQLRDTTAAIRLAAFYAHYPSIDEEPVGAALRGQDPSLFAGVDLVLLISDGQVRPLIDVTRKPVLQAPA